MADDEPEDGTPQTSDTDSSEDESNDEPVESLVTGRERRKTAGNRYDRDMVLEEVADEEDPDEVALLFAEEGEDEDEEFKSDEPEDDADMSSSDDDDQGPNAAAEDLDGENEIQKQAKVERARKRKADFALTTMAGIRKKPKIDPTQLEGPTVVKKPTKKKERVTWVPDSIDGGGKKSLRKQTIAHREITIAKLKQSEAQSKKLKAAKEIRDREKAKYAPKEMTQEDRLAEAARVERRNAKSLNRWEALEKKRVEEQAAKLAALKNRTLHGPVLTLWSAKAKWIGPRLNKLGSKDATGIVEGVPEVKKRGRKSKAYHEQMAALREAGLVAAGNTPISGAQAESTPVDSLSGKGDETLQDSMTSIQQPQITFTAPQGPDNFLQGIHEYATQQPDAADTSTNATSPVTPANQVEEQQDTLQKIVEPTHSTVSADNPDQSNRIASPSKQDNETNQGEKPLDNPSNETDQGERPEGEPEQTPADPSLVLPPSTDLEPSQPLVEEYSTRNLIILDKFEELSSNEKYDFGVFYGNRKSARLPKHTNELCPITTLPIRYRDPSSGIGFANMTAYKKLQDLKDHKFRWSSMLGCYIGRAGGAVARGVPEGFLGS